MANENTPNGTPTETTHLAIGPNPDGHDDQAVAAQTLDEQLEAAPDVAETEDDSPSSSAPTSHEGRED